MFLRRTICTLGYFIASAKTNQNTRENSYFFGSVVYFKVITNLVILIAVLYGKIKTVVSSNGTEVELVQNRDIFIINYSVSA